MTRRHRVAWRLAAVLIAGATALAAAVYFRAFFAARECAGMASPELAALLAADSPFEKAFWLASPHQNLGALDERVGDLELYLAEISRLTGVATPRLPGFGPFRLPPARELALAWNGSGERFLAVARIETGIGWIARLAGRLAGNPWLAGGRVEAGGKTFQVSWQGPLWIVASGLPAELGLPRSAALTPEDQVPAIARFVLRREVGPIPAGRFALARGVDGLEVRSGELPAVVRAASDWTSPGIALWLSSSDRGPIGGPGLFLLWGAAEGAIPRVAVLQRGGGRSFKLPGEAILAMLGAGEPAFRLGWAVRGTEKSARREALLMVPWFERHLPRPGGRGAWLGRAGRLVPAASARTLDLLVRNLEKLPLLPAGEVQRLAAAARLLAPFEGCAAIAFEVWHDPEGARVRLCTRQDDRAEGPGTTPESRNGEPSTSEDGEIDAEPPIR
ncbi:MAG: hypothetical protein ABI689_06295 [Thermoanaerobaculia bacterium]